MRRLLPVLCAAALVLGACKLTETKLSSAEETRLKIRLVHANKASISATQRNLFLRKRFGTEERVYEGMDRMREINRTRSRGANRESNSLAENHAMMTGPRVTRVPVKPLFGE